MSGRICQVAGEVYGARGENSLDRGEGEGIMTSWEHENGETGQSGDGAVFCSVPALLAFVPRPDSFSAHTSAHCLLELHGRVLLPSRTG